jgi:hypothetical protein
MSAFPYFTTYSKRLFTPFDWIDPLPHYIVLCINFGLPKVQRLR